MKSTIVLIENQKYQFETIVDNMGAHFAVYPPLDCFKGFIDDVRVYLNLRFPKTMRDGCKAAILARLKNGNNPDLFIIDYKLIGNHDGRKGTDLAIMLAQEFSGVPMIFLSRTEKTRAIEEDITTLTAEGTTTHWVPKGFAGASILNAEYFENFVLEVIYELLDQPKIDKTRALIRIILDSDQFDSVAEKKTGFGLLRRYLSDTIPPNQSELILNFNLSDSSEPGRDSFINTLLANGSIP